jgi:ComF family protein
VAFVSSFRTLGTIAANLLGELVAPSRCAACDGAITADVLFCAPCAASVERVEDGPPPDGAEGWLAAFEYGGAIGTAITRLKYQGRADLAERLGRSMLPAAKRIGVVDLVVPVPLHPRRLAERGYNQAALLAARVARALGVKSAPRALSRSRDTPRQAALDRATRLLNVAGAFSVRERERVSGARVLLIDDVRTTGATLEGCIAALQGAGAQHVLALVLARRA